MFALTMLGRMSVQSTGRPRLSAWCASDKAIDWGNTSGPTVRRYRVYFYDEAGLIAGVHTIDRENNEDAMSAGQPLLDGTSFAVIEVWEKGRRVGSAEW